MAMVWVNRIAAVLMVCLMFFLAVKRYVFDDGKLRSNRRFTIATVYRISYPAEGGPDADYQYCVNQVTYKNSASISTQKPQPVVGDKFLLKYYPPDPQVARILLDKPIDSLLISKMQIDTCGR
ncbi:hypothetical protein HNQ91_003158 [Filimonas zeae]|uniref:Uncharacterized protein n=1 Tax=Filimonas zeae TaxID=1737353 RepID=A0A917IYG0_9BACT|nr:hypothetical protein [Filimonas zeae]MDR6340093.1 hypothetical protein [Filimonas zeae]GGH71101.1 hypothetical protein GCM10011379_30090 [Filimonas zeae]